MLCWEDKLLLFLHPECRRNLYNLLHGIRRRFGGCGPRRFWSMMGPLNPMGLLLHFSAWRCGLALVLGLSACSARHHVNLSIGPPDPTVVTAGGSGRVGGGAPIVLVGNGGATIGYVQCKSAGAVVEIRNGFIFYMIPVADYPQQLPDRCRVVTGDGQVVALRVYATE